MLVSIKDHRTDNKTSEASERIESGREHVCGVCWLVGKTLASGFKEPFGEIGGSLA
jgi:hypothetical protein